MAITRAQALHVYPATSGTGVAFGSNNVLGNLLIVCCHGSGTATFTVSDTQGNAWTHLTLVSNTVGTAVASRIAYCLSCKAGANSVTATSANADLGFEALEYNAGSGKTWGFDVESVKSAAGATLSPTTNAWSTSGSEDIIVAAFGDEEISNTVTAGTNFTLIEYESGQIEAQEQWLGAGVQTNQTASFTLSTTPSGKWVITLAAFKALSSTNTDPPFGLLSQPARHYRPDVVAV